MNDTIKRRLNRLDELYSEKRINGVKKRLNLLWDQGIVEDRIPYAFRRRALPKYLPDNFSLSNFTGEARLRMQLDDIIDKAYIEDDYVPSLITDDGAYNLAEAFGCQGDYYQGLFVAHPIVFSARDVRKLKKPDIRKAKGQLGNHLELVKYFVDETEGRLPIHIGDIQGPLSVAGSIWDNQAFFLALYDSLGEMKWLLSLIAECIAEYVETILGIVGKDNLVPIHCLPFLWRRPGSGICLSEDNIPLISAEMFDEYDGPLLSLLSDRFGKLVVHSCGDCSTNIDTLVGKGYIQGLQFSQTPIRNIIGKIPSGVVLISKNDWSSRDELNDYVALIKSKKKAVYLQIQSVVNEMGPDEKNVADLYSFVKEIVRL